jgi:hypothetical protein
MFPAVDTKNAPAVAAFVTTAFRRMYPGENFSWLELLFRDIQRLFGGSHPDFNAIDLRYHDLEHTLQATVCLVVLLEGRHAAAVEPRLDARHFELAISAALLHDAGYLKQRSDTTGTGAKYTYCHVLRSCAFAASYLPSLGADDFEIEAVLGAINCTGPAKEISRLRFRQPIDRIIGCALATSDYLGQMAAADYPDELEILFDEFKESDDYIHLAPERRAFRNAAELIEHTPTFWRTVVLPKLEGDFQAVYRFLVHPYPHGRNEYIDAVERNIDVIKSRLGGHARKSSAVRV